MPSNRVRDQLYNEWLQELMIHPKPVAHCSEFETEGKNHACIVLMYGAAPLGSESFKNHFSINFTLNNDTDFFLFFP
jgi:hypothetical protein